MSDPEAGLSPMDVPASKAIDAAHLPSLASQTTHPKTTPGLAQSPQMHRPQCQLSEPARLNLLDQTLRAPATPDAILPADEEKLLADYCNELPHDDDISEKLAVATWKAKYVNFSNSFRNCIRQPENG